MSKYKQLKKGSKGVEVARMQRMLIARGYVCGDTGADGEFGTATLSAVLAFQHAKGLEADGIAGDKTLGALYTIDHAAVGKAVEKCVRDVEKLASFEKLEVLLGG